jgi:peptidoglycan lytic transglycosylase G
MPSRSRRRRSRRPLILGALLVTLVVVTIIVRGLIGTPGGAGVRVTVPPGAGFHVAADSLAAKGIVYFPRFFRAYAGLLGRDRELKAGTYMLRRGMSWPDLVRALTRGEGIIVHTITIPEGYDLSQIVPMLARTLSVPEDSVRTAVSDTAELHRLDIPTPTVEGYLFPDTYAFAEGTPPHVAVDLMIQRFLRVWKPEWDERLQTLAMTRHDIMALASIIEKEAVLPEERPVISAVYHNRLKARMALQADPTVQYALGHHVGRVLYKDLAIESRYNTYKYRGLPPGPIASPGAPSIQAALFPADVPFLYFVAHPDGHHEFRRTYAEHRAAIREIRKRADSAARAAATPSR